MCDEYELRGDKIVAKYSADSEKGWKTYKPLEEVPDLFLKFVRLHKEPNFVDAALEWSHKYGVPGGDSWGVHSERDEMPLAMFSEESRRAWILFSIYEAALGRDAPTIKSLIARYPDEALVKALVLDPPREEQDDEDLLVLDLFLSVWEVTSVVQTLCSPRLVPFVDFEGSRWVTRIESTWQFSNLLGAMYLQIYQLIASGGDIARCEFCGLAIPLSRPRPDGRKRRRDKRFCDDACRQANHRSNKKA